VLVSVVIPVYNEEGMLARCLEQVSGSLDSVGCDRELIVVDDGSVDATWQKIVTLAAAEPLRGRLKGVRLSRNFGKEAAILAGLCSARGDAVIVIDADLQHPPALIPRMLALWDGGKVDVVEAVKRIRQRESWVRRIGANLYYRLFAVASGMDMRNATDFKLLDRRVVEHYIALPESSRFFRGLTAWLGFRRVGIEFDPPERWTGDSGWSLRMLLRMARRTIISFSALPLRLLSWLGLLGLMFSLALTLHTLWSKWQGLSEEGFPTVILLILGMGSMILLGLGLIGEYISEIYNEVKRRPQFIVSDLAPEADRLVGAGNDPGRPAGVGESDKGASR
jgi:glycosyltransferase involved in cell wall biosynthesis